MHCKKITLSIDGVDYEFNITGDAYEQLQNEMQPDNKVAPMHNFLMRTLANQENKDTLKKLCEQGLTLEIAGKLVEEFRPQVEILVKK